MAELIAERAINLVCAQYKIRREVLLSPHRQSLYTQFARALVMTLAWRGGMTQARIAEIFGSQVTRVHKAISRLNVRVMCEPYVAQKVADAQRALGINQREAA